MLELSPDTKKLVVNVFNNDEYSFSKQVTLVEILNPPSQLSSNSSLKSKNQLFPLNEILNQSETCNIEKPTKQMLFI